MLFRAVRHDPEYIHPDHNTGGWILDKKAMTFERGDESVFCHHMLRECDDSYRQVATHGGAANVRRVVFRLVAGSARGLHFKVGHTPNTRTPIGYSHGDITKPDGLARNEFRARRRELFRLTDPVDPADVTLPRQADQG